VLDETSFISIAVQHMGAKKNLIIQMIFI